MYVHILISIYTAHANGFDRLFINTYIFIQIHIYIYIYIYVHTCKCMHVFAYVYHSGIILSFVIFCQLRSAWGDFRLQRLEGSG